MGLYYHNIWAISSHWPIKHPWGCRTRLSHGPIACIVEFGQLVHIFWLQLNGLWHLVSGQEKKPAPIPKVKDSTGNTVSPAVTLDEDKLEKWEIKAEQAAGALKTGMSHDIKVLIQDCEDNPILIWETLKTLFIQQRTVPHFNAYYALLSVKKSDSEPLDTLINRINEQIRVIKLLSPTSFTLDNLYDELVVMAIIRVLPHSFDDIVWTISVLDKFDKQSVVQSL